MQEPRAVRPGQDFRQQGDRSRGDGSQAWIRTRLWVTRQAASPSELWPRLLL